MNTLKIQTNFKIQNGVCKMSKIITVFIELMSATLEWLHTNLDGIIVSIVAAVILSLIHYIKINQKK